MLELYILKPPDELCPENQIVILSRLTESCSGRLLHFIE